MTPASRSLSICLDGTPHQYRVGVDYAVDGSSKAIFAVSHDGGDTWEQVGEVVESDKPLTPFIQVGKDHTHKAQTIGTPVGAPCGYCDLWGECKGKSVDLHTGSVIVRLKGHGVGPDDIIEFNSEPLMNYQCPAWREKTKSWHPGGAPSP